MSDNLHAKVALVTGASSGIGEATARQLSAAGVKVVVIARRKDRLDQLVAEIKKDGGEALALEVDVTDTAACEQAVQQAHQQWGTLDILINNAGVMLLGPVQDAPLTEWERMVDLNIKGLLYMTHATLPHMTKQGSGHIVNISSVAGRTVRSGSAVYNLTKWGVGAFSESLRQELSEAKTGIRMTLIEPGAVNTELTDHLRPEIKDSIQQRFAGIRRLESDDIAAAIVYALSQPPHVSVNEVLIRPTDQAG
jgi:NADP-dependent 3-hydroxy acid dehydrogenase YdfG